MVTVLIAACGCIADLITKHLVFKWLGINAYFLVEDPTAIARWHSKRRIPHLAWLWTNRFGFQTSLNEADTVWNGRGVVVAVRHFFRRRAGRNCHLALRL